LSYFKFNGKKVFYDIKGSGLPLLLVHDNSLSSKMFQPVLQYYLNTFKVILVDLPGYGKSEKLPQFPKDLWFENSKALAELISHLDIRDVNVIGSGGGAITAFNLMLEHPELLKCLITDGFTGKDAIKSFASNIHVERERQKKKLPIKLIWLKNHGISWRRVIDNESDAIYAHFMEIKQFFHKDLSSIKKPILLAASLDDELFKDKIVDVYAEIKSEILTAQSHYFHSGSHPAIISNAEEFAKIATGFIKSAAG